MIASQAISAGDLVAFATYTVRHHAGDSLADVWDRTTEAWKAVTQSKGYRRGSQRGFLKVVEVTYGDNGWHVHLHVLWFFPPQIAGVSLDAFGLARRDEWIAAVHSRGGFALSSGQDFRLLDGPHDVHLATYLTKATDTIGLEMTSTETKVWSKTRPVWEVLTAAINGEAWAVPRWLEWESGSKGKRQLSTSAGLRDLYGVPEVSDDALAKLEEGFTVLCITRDGWAKVASRAGLGPRILSVLESSGVGRLVDLLEAEGVEWRPADQDHQMHEIAASRYLASVEFRQGQA